MIDDRFWELMTLLGELPTDVLATKAREVFPGLVNDPAERADFRELLRGVAMCRRQLPVTPETAAQVAAELNAIRQAGGLFRIDGRVVASFGPKPEPRSAEDFLSASAVDLAAADTADALAAAFDEARP